MSWARSEKETAQVRKFEPVLKIIEEAETDILQNIFYHRKCRPSFTRNNI